MKTIEGIVWGGQKIIPDIEYGLVASTNKGLYLLERGASHKIMHFAGRVNSIAGSMDATNPRIYIGLGESLCYAVSRHDVLGTNFVKQIVKRDGEVQAVYVNGFDLLDAGDYNQVNWLDMELAMPTDIALASGRIPKGTTRLIKYGDHIIGLMPENEMDYMMHWETTEVQMEKVPGVVDYCVHNNQIYLAKKTSKNKPAIEIRHSGDTGIIATRQGSKAILQSAGHGDKKLFDAVGDRIYDTFEDPNGSKPLWILDDEITSLTSLLLPCWQAFYEASQK